MGHAFVTVKLQNHATQGSTGKDFALAPKVEDLLTWQPGAQADSGLEGTPDHPRFKYLKYD